MGMKPAAYPFGLVDAILRRISSGLFGFQRALPRLVFQRSQSLIIQDSEAILRRRKKPLEWMVEIQMNAYDFVVDLLSRKAILFKIHQHKAVRTIHDAERIAPTLVAGLLKTIAFKIKDSFWVLAAVRCQDRIDYRKLAAALNVNRRQLHSLSPEEVQTELGYEIGGVGPIPLRGDVKAVFDSSLRDAGTIYCGSGSNTLTLELEFADLLRVTQGKIYPIVRESSKDDDASDCVTF
jgi:Cys-tRNA(Pro)/Cys-tRNA(Cys) deacylase